MKKDGFNSVVDAVIRPIEEKHLRCMNCNKSGYNRTGLRPIKNYYTEFQQNQDPYWAIPCEWKCYRGRINTIKGNDNNV